MILFYAVINNIFNAFNFNIDMEVNYCLIINIGLGQNHQSRGENSKTHQSTVGVENSSQYNEFCSRCSLLHWTGN